MESYCIKDLTFQYPTGKQPALQHVSLSIPKGSFLTICGASGCGKSTLLRHLKPSLTPHGKTSGEIIFSGKPLSEVDMRDQASKIGFVMQSPDNQIVTDKVWHELAFGLESLGVAQQVIRRRVAEMASFFGIQTWFHKSVSDLSGGQKQLLCLASIMTMQPEVLILDEPTSQLDPIAASEFLAMIGKVHQELGMTVIITEHRLEEIFPLSDEVAVMENGSILCIGTPKQVGEQLKDKKHSMFHALPVPMRVYASLKTSLPCPITVRDGHSFLQEVVREKETLQPLFPVPEKYLGEKQEAVSLDEVFFRYDAELPDVLKGLTLTAYTGEILAVLGGNGTGKTTTLSVIAGIHSPYRGKVKLMGKPIDAIRDQDKFHHMLGVLPQNPQALFVKKTVREDLLEILSSMKYSPQERVGRLKQIAKLCRLEDVLDQHPYDLSGGQQQRAGLAKVLLLQPRILLLDEPTKGLDADYKYVFAQILDTLAASGVCIVMVSHDTEFCAEHATRCAMFFDGSVVSEGPPRPFFSGNRFYTSSASRMAQGLIPNAVTATDIVTALGGREPVAVSEMAVKAVTPDTMFWDENHMDQTQLSQKTSKKPPFFVGKQKLFFIIALLCIGMWGILSDTESFKAFISGGAEAEIAAQNIYYVCKFFLSTGCVLASFIVFSLSLPKDASFVIQIPVKERKLKKRTICAAIMILLLIPVTIYIGIYYLNDRKYHFISVFILIESMLPFLFIYEGKKPKAREMVVIAVLTAIGVSGRVALFMLPQFKPVVAIAIIAGVSFGGETGFLVGALSGLLSNILMGQGPWTPWQMFGFGIIGFLAGFLFQKGFLRKSKVSLCVFGGITTFFIYGVLLDAATVIMAQSKLTKEMFFAASLQGIFMNLIHSFATVFFLLILSRPMLEKLERIKVKYGLID